VRFASRTVARGRGATWILQAALAASPARAQSSPDDVKKADKLFRDAQKQLKAGNVHEACASFAESQRLDPAVGTLLNLADCHAQEHKTATARGEFEAAATLAQKSGQREREAFAQSQLKELEQVLSFVTVRFVNGASVDDVKVDGTPLDRASLATPIALDPGKHTFLFGGTGHTPRAVDIDVALGPSTQVLDVQPLPLAPAAPVATRDAPRTEPKGAIKGEGFPRKPTAIALGALGVVGLGVGTYFGIVASGKKSDAEPHCMGKFCDPDGLALQDDAHSAATLSTIAVAVGLVSIGAGAYLWFTAPRAKSTALFVSPTLGGARLGIGW
jgi:hypothetical protein